MPWARQPKTVTSSRSKKKKKIKEKRWAGSRWIWGVSTEAFELPARYHPPLMRPALGAFERIGEAFWKRTKKGKSKGRYACLVARGEMGGVRPGGPITSAAGVKSGRKMHNGQIAPVLWTGSASRGEMKGVWAMLEKKAQGVRGVSVGFPVSPR